MSFKFKKNPKVWPLIWIIFLNSYWISLLNSILIQYSIFLRLEKNTSLLYDLLCIFSNNFFICPTNLIFLMHLYASYFYRYHFSFPCHKFCFYGNFPNCLYSYTAVYTRLIAFYVSVKLPFVVNTNWYFLQYVLFKNAELFIKYIFCF